MIAHKYSFRPAVLLVVVVGCLIATRGLAQAPIADYGHTETQFYSGDYSGCMKICQSQIDQRTWNSRWTILLIRCHLETGHYEEALKTYEAGLERFSDDIRMRLIGVDVYHLNNRPVDAKRQLEEITATVQRMPWRYNGSDEIVAVGKLLASQGEDARQILELCYDRALKQNSSNIEALIASTELALDKADFAVAAQTIEKAIKVQPDNSFLHFLKAKAWEESDGEKADAALKRALELNPKHVRSLLMVAENQIDAESYSDALKTIDEALKVNAQHPIAWALKSVIAHLEGDYEKEGEFRKEALKPWKLNPEVDFTIGTKLSRHYRFDEAATALNRALSMNPEYQPAMFALAQDLLRLGRTDEGWELLSAVRQADQYNVVAFNLTKLKDQLAKFATLEAPGLVVRMEAKEAEVYGSAVIDLLSRARQTLVAKYKAELREPVYIEIFDRQSDFAIRTFGLPGGAGYLGVCFGQLITANSPASGGDNPTNWQSVLWHEYCHVVTLQKSKNRMPRWLSEGISVYEERIENSTWGQPMDRHYRQMILSEDFTPMSELSSAFMSPKSGMHLQFAYFESSLAVQFLIEQYGFDSLLRVLDDLGVGMPINQALERVTGSLTKLDEQFRNWAEAQAKSYAADGDWTPLPQGETQEVIPGLVQSVAPLQLEDIQKFLEEHPKSPLALRSLAESSLRAREFETAKGYLTTLQEIEPNDQDVDGVYAMLAAANQGLKDSNAAEENLRKLAEICPNPLQALETLIAIDAAAENWPSVDQLTTKYLAVQPMKVFPHEWVLKSAQAQNNLPQASHSLAAMLQLAPIDPAELHFQLGQALAEAEPGKAKRHVLQALEIAPRYLEALQWLQSQPTEINSPTTPQPNSAAQ